MQDLGIIAETHPAVKALGFVRAATVGPGAVACVGYGMQLIPAQIFPMQRTETTHRFGQACDILHPRVRSQVPGFVRRCVGSFAGFLGPFAGSFAGSWAENAHPMRHNERLWRI
jgi:hypothetical protein